MPAIPDDHVVRVLRPFVAATGPVLRGLRDADPFRLGRLARRRALELQESGGRAPEEAPTSRRGKAARVARTGRARALDRLATSKLPGTPRWQTMSPEERDDWWVSRVGRFTSIVASIPGIGGALARRLPVSDILGIAAQGLVICAIAGEHGLNRRDEQVRLLASVLFGRDVDPSRYGDPHAADVEREAGELSGTVGRGEGGAGPVLGPGPGGVADGDHAVGPAVRARPAPEGQPGLADAGERARRRRRRELPQRAFGAQARGPRRGALGRP